MADLIAQQGIATGYSWPIVDADGQPADLTGWTAACQVRQQESPTSTLLAALAATLDGSSVVVSWTAAESLTWTWTDGWSDVLLIDPDGVPRLVVWQGRMVVDRVVTVHG